VAQNTNSGDIRGTVLDALGAVVPGVTVTLTNIDTGETKNFVTNDNGIYDTVSTRPGNYNLTFKKEGFKQVTRGPIQLQVSVIKTRRPRSLKSEYGSNAPQAGADCYDVVERDWR
jgi:hypothetical protein